MGRLEKENEEFERISDSLSDSILIENGISKEEVNIMSDEQKLEKLIDLDLKENGLS